MDPEVDKDKTTAEEESGTPESKETNPESVTTTPEVPSEGASYYKTQLEKTQAELEKAKFTLNQNRLEEKEKENKAPEAEAISAEEIAQKVRAQMLEEANQAFKANLASRITDADELAEVEYHLENTIKSSGDNEKDLAIAIKLAGAKKAEAINAELNFAKKATPITNKVPGTPPKEGEQELNKKEKAFSDAIDKYK